MKGDLASLVYSLIDRYMNGGTGHLGNTRYIERHAMVTSYDPQKYLAKVMLQPEQQETGWIPIETGHIGEDYGIAVGLQPGDGKSIGDQVIVRYQEGDLESAKVVQRVHSDDEKPPTVQAGELVIWTRFKNSGGGDDSDPGAQGGTGQQIFLKNDGSLSLTDGNGATIKLDGKGNIIVDCKTFTVVAQNDAGIKAAGNVVFKAASKLGIVAGEAVWQSGGDVSDGSVTPPNSAPPVPPFQTP